MRKNINLARFIILIWAYKLSCAEPNKPAQVEIEMTDFRLRHALPMSGHAPVVDTAFVATPVPAVVQAGSDIDSDFSEASDVSHTTGYISSDSSADDDTRFKITPQELMAAKQAILLRSARQRALLDEAIDLLLVDSTGLTPPPA